MEKQGKGISSIGDSSSIKKTVLDNNSTKFDAVELRLIELSRDQILEGFTSKTEKLDLILGYGGH